MHSEILQTKERPQIELIERKTNLPLALQNGRIIWHFCIVSSLIHISCVIFICFYFFGSQNMRKQKQFNLKKEKWFEETNRNVICSFLCVFQKNKILFAIRRTAARIGQKVQQQWYDPLPIIAWRQTHLWCLTNEPASTWWQMCVSFHHNFVIKCTFAARFLCTRVHALSSIYVSFSLFFGGARIVAIRNRINFY